MLGIPSNPIVPSHYVYPDLDSETDNDGLLMTGTGFGVHLGTTQRDYFSCGQRWQVDPLNPDEWVTGSWYRQYFSDVQYLDYANHSTMMKDQGAGQWLRDQILDQAGPYVHLSQSGWCDEISQWQPE